MRTYCFIIKTVGTGNTKQEAWDEALDAIRLEDMEVDDIEIEWEFEELTDDDLRDLYKV